MRRGWLALGKLEERKTQGEIQKMKHKSNFINETHLRPWFELIGTYNGLEIDEYFVYIKIDDKVVSFSKDSEEALYVQEKLDSSVVGRKIGVLKTDLQEKLVRIRLVD